MKEILKAVQDMKVKTESIKKNEKFRDLKGDLRGKLHQQNKRHGKRISEIEDTIGKKKDIFFKENAKQIQVQNIYKIRDTRKITNLKIIGVGKMRSVCSQIRTGGTRNVKLAVLSLQRYKCVFPLC